MGVGESGRLSESCVEVQTALSAAAALLHLSANQSGDHKCYHGQVSPQTIK